MRNRSLLLLIVCGLLVVAQPGVRGQSPVGPDLKKVGDLFTVDGSTSFLLFASYYDALHTSPAAWNEDLTYLKSKGFSGVRILPNWFADYCPNVPASDTLIGSGGTINGPTLQKLKDFLSAASARGMVVDITFTKDTVQGGISFAHYKSAISQVTVALLNYRNALFDVQNEYVIQDKLTPEQVQELIQAVHAADGSRIAAGSRGTSPGTGGAGAVQSGSEARAGGHDFVAFHDPRNLGHAGNADWWTESAAITQIAAVKQGLQSVVKPIDYQEPMPWGPFPGCANNEQDSTSGHARQAAKFAKKHGAAAWTFHTRLSFELAGTSLVSRLKRRFQSEGGARGGEGVGRLSALGSHHTECDVYHG